MDYDQAPPFPTRGDNSRFVDPPPPRRTTSTDFTYAETVSMANSAMSQFSSAHPPRDGRTTHTDAHFFFTPAAQPPTANSAVEDVLARSTAHVPVNWHTQPAPGVTARTEQQNESRPDGGTDTYEARTLEIMQYVWDLSDNYDRLQAHASRHQPYPEDNYQRLSQLYTSVRSIIDELRHDCTQYTHAMGDWDVLNTEHLSKDSEWSRLMLQHRRTFFEDPAFVPKQLDEKQMELLDYYGRIQQHIEDIIKERDDAACTANLRTRTANSAVGYTNLSVTQQQCAAVRLGTQLPPNDSTEPDARRPRNILGEPLPPPIRLGWSTARGGIRKNPTRPTANSAVGTAPSSGLAANSAACHLGGPGSLATTTSGPSEDRTKPLMSSFTSSAAARRGPSNASSGPLQVGADGKPFSGSIADAKQLPPKREDTDFGPENTCAFYRNATYQRSTATVTSPWPVLKELPLTPFAGDDRTYAAFRDSFLELVESHPRLEPRHKMQHLLQYLRGEPHSLVSGYAITDANYFRAVDLLEERYGDQRRLGLKLLQQLVTTHPPREDARELRKFHDECFRLLSDLRQCGENPDATAVIAQTLLSKLPSSVRQDIIRRAGHPDGGLFCTTVLVKLYDHLRVLEAADAMSFNRNARDPSGQLCRGDSQSFSRNQPSSNRHQQSRYTNLMADAQAIQPQCAFCSRAHWASECDTYDTRAKRYRRARQLSYCLLCLRGGHRTDTCPKRTDDLCRYCNNGPHHQSLCSAAQRRREDARPGPMCTTKTKQAKTVVPRIATQKEALGRPSTASRRKDVRPGPMSATKTEPARTVVPRIATQKVALGRPSTASPKGLSPKPKRPNPMQQGPPGGTDCTQENRDVTPVSRPDAPSATTATNPRLPSAQISSVPGKSNSKDYRRGKSKGTRTGPKGRDGTTRPTTPRFDENVTQMDAHASGGDRILLDHQRYLMTDRRSTPDKKAQFSRHLGDGSETTPGGVDGTLGAHELYNEDFLPTNHCGHPADGAPLERRIDEATHRFAKTRRHEDDAPTPLLECLLTTAKNPWTDDSCAAVVVFDRCRTTSLITKGLVRVLKLPAASTPTADFDSFTGYHTCIDLLPLGGSKLSIDHIFTGRLPAEVRTVLVDEKLLAALRRSQRPLEVIYAQPHLLIGLDVMTRVQYRHGPRLLGSLFSVHTRLGVALGGNPEAGSDDSSKASTTNSRLSSVSDAAPDAADAENPSRPGSKPTPSNSEQLRSQLRHWLFGQPAYPMANSAMDSALHATNERLESSTSTAFSSGQPPSLTRVSGTTPRPPQKQLSPNPLDTLPLLLPANSTTYVEIEEVSATNSAAVLPKHAVEEVHTANSAVGLPRPNQEPFYAEDADVRRSRPPPTRGNPIHASPYDAGSPTTRKTRLRYRLPDYARQILGIYTAHEPASTVVMLPTKDSPPLSLRGADQGFFSTTSAPSPCPLPPPAAGQRTFGRSRSRRENLCELRSPSGPQTHARVTSDQRPPDSAHQQPARNAHKQDADPSTGQQPTPQSLASWPTDPTTVRLPAPLPLGRVRIDPHPKRPTDEICHNKPRPFQRPAAELFSSCISQAPVHSSEHTAVISQPNLSLTPSSLAPTTCSTMGKGRRKSRNLPFSTPADDEVDDDGLYIVVDDQGNRRAVPPQQIERMVTGDELAEAMIHQADLRTDDRDEPEDTRQGVPGMANSAIPVASTTSSGAVTTTEPCASSANSAETKGTADQDSKAKPDDRSSKSHTSSTKPKDPRKKKDSSAKVRRQPRTELTADELASLEIQFTISQAQLLIHQDTRSRSDADFRRELTHFWDNWRDINWKKEGDTPAAWTEDWKTHKLGKILWARYKKYRLDVLARELDDRRGITANISTGASTSATTSSTAAITGQTTTSTGTTSTSRLETISSSVIDSTTSEPMDTSAPADSELPLTLTDEDLRILEEPDDSADHPDATKFAEEFLRGAYDHIDETDQDESKAQPPACTANSAVTQGVESSGTANSAAPAAGNGGEAMQVPSMPPPPARRASSSQSGAEDRGRPPSSAKRTRETSGTTRSPPAHRGRKTTPPPKREPSPGVERHRIRRAVEQDRLLSPIIDPRVFKDTAVAYKLSGGPPSNWLESFRHQQMEFLGQINAFQAPWIFLKPDQYDDAPYWRMNHTLKGVTIEGILEETARLPERYLLGHTFGIDPILWEMVTDKTREALMDLAMQKYVELAPGKKFRGLGIGPTGIDLSECGDYNACFHGQLLAFLYHAEAAAKSGKCLSIRVNKDDAAGRIAIHDEARKVLHKAGIEKNHPIYLQEFRANYHELCDWLDAYPNTVIAFDLALLGHLEHVAQTVAPDNGLHEAAIGLLEFCNLVPLANLALHSGAFSPQLSYVPRDPTDLLKAADALQRLTDTQGTVYLEQTAASAARIYRLDPELLDRARWTEDRRQRPRCTIQTLRQAIDATIIRRRLAPPAPRADQDQGAANRTLAAPTANSAVGQRGVGPKTPPTATLPAPPPPPSDLPHTTSGASPAVIVPSVAPSPAHSEAGSRSSKGPKIHGDKKLKYRARKTCCEASTSTQEPLHQPLQALPKPLTKPT